MTERLPTWLRTILNLIIVLMALFGWAVGYWFGKESVKDEVIWLPSLYEASPTETEAPKIKKHRLQDGIRNKGMASVATPTAPKGIEIGESVTT